MESKRNIVVIEEMTAKNIVAYILETYGEDLSDISLKNKKKIVQEAKNIIAQHATVVVENELELRKYVGMGVISDAVYVRDISGSFPVRKVRIVFEDLTINYVTELGTTAYYSPDYYRMATEEEISEFYHCQKAPEVQEESIEESIQTEIEFEEESVIEETTVAQECPGKAIPEVTLTGLSRKELRQITRDHFGAPIGTFFKSLETVRQIAAKTFEDAGYVVK